MSRSAIPTRRALNSQLSQEMGREVVLLDAVEVEVGQMVIVGFEEVQSSWRQGVWLGTEGELEIHGFKSSQVVLWTDSAPNPCTLTINATDGLLRLCNVWDSGRRLGDYESQRATSGMLVTDETTFRRYRCNDIGSEPSFEKLVFTLEITK